jgi:hypothetical protein
MFLRRTSPTMALRLSFDCADQRFVVGSRPSATRCDYNAMRNFFFFNFNNQVTDYLFTINIWMLCFHDLQTTCPFMDWKTGLV